MATLDLTAYAAAIKQYYKNIDFSQMVYKKFPFFGMVPKNTDWVGSPLKQPTTYATVPNRSATFTTGQNVAGTSSQVAFLPTSVHDYGFAFLDRETMLASKSDDGAWLKSATHEIDMAVKEVSKSAAASLFLDGAGVIGQISASSTITSTTITLSDPRQAVNFQVNDVIQAVAPGTAVLNTYAAAVRSGGAGTVTITAVNRSTGQLTASAAWSTGITSIAAGDYLLKSGDFNAKISGLSAWLPLTPPASTDSFFSVNRSVDSRLYGVYTDGRGMPLEEVGILAAANIFQEGGSPDIWLMNLGNWTNLINALGAKKIYFREGEVKADGADIGYNAVEIEGPAGPIRVVADPFCPSNLSYMLELDTWKLYSRDEVPHIFDIDGKSGDMLRQATADAYEVRVGYYAQLVCEAPVYNGVIQLR